MSLQLDHFSLAIVWELASPVHASTSTLIPALNLIAQLVPLPHFLPVAHFPATYLHSARMHWVQFVGEKYLGTAKTMTIIYM